MDSYCYVGYEPILYILKEKNGLDSMKKFVSYTSNGIYFPIGIAHRWDTRHFTYYDFPIFMTKGAKLFDKNVNGTKGKETIYKVTYRNLCTGLPIQFIQVYNFLWFSLSL